MTTVEDNTKERVGGEKNSFLLKSQEDRCLCFRGFSTVATIQTHITNESSPKC